MRLSPFALAAVAGLGLLFFPASRADAVTVTITTPSGLRHAAEVLDPTETVHCRRYPHRHRYGHRFGRGCRAGVIITQPRYGVVIRDGVRVRSHTRTTIRSGPGPATRGERTTIRSRSEGQTTGAGQRSGDTPRALPSKQQQAPAAPQQQQAPAAKPGGADTRGQ